MPKKGYKQTKEHKKKLSEAGKRRVGTLNFFYGKKHSEATKRKMRANHWSKKEGYIPPCKGKHWKIKNTSKMHHTPWNKGRADIKCQSCGKTFQRNYKGEKFCSIICRSKNWVGENHPNWKGGYERKLWHNRRRRAKKFENGGSHTQQEWEELKKKCNYICIMCRKKEPEIKLTEDHIIPLSKGGCDNIENIQPLCRICNTRKFNN